MFFSEIETKVLKTIYINLKYAIIFPYYDKIFVSCSQKILQFHTYFQLSTKVMGERVYGIRQKKGPFR